MNTPKYFAIYTGSPAELAVIFAHRDNQARADMADTCNQLTEAGEHVTLIETDQLADLTDIICQMPLCGTARIRLANTPSLPGVPDPEPCLPVAAAVPPVEPRSDLPSDAALTAIHQCLRLLAGRCDGARTLDGSGFNKMDAEFGRSLAEARSLTPKQAASGQKLIRKYHKQLPPDLFERAVFGNNGSGTAVLTVPGALRCPDEPETGKQSAPSVQFPTPAELINAKYKNASGDEIARNGCEEHYGDTYQNGVRPGLAKLAQFLEVLQLAGIPKLYEGVGHWVVPHATESFSENVPPEKLVYVKLFDPSGSWTWYLLEFSETAPDGTPNLAFGLVDGHEPELGYIDIAELAHAKGSMGIGIEIDMHFRPQPLSQIPT